MIGFTRSVEFRLKKRSIESGSGQTPTTLFIDIATANHFNLSPSQWRRLPRIDKKILHYCRAMQVFYQDIANENAKQKTDFPKPKLRW